MSAIYRASRRALSRALERFRPRTILAIRAKRALVTGEAELRLLPVLCDASKTSVDVGCNLGIYSYHLSHLSRRVEAFEPNPGLAALARRSLPRNCTVHQVALSDTAGQLELRYPRSSGMDLRGHGSIEPLAVSGDVEVIPVEVRTLDSLAVSSVGFIKIDVEGHEHAAVAGARETITRDRPNILVEVEERHRAGAVGDMSALLSGLGYVGYYLRDGRVHRLSTLDLARDQDPLALTNEGILPGRTYIYNFIFLPAEAEGVMLSRLDDWCDQLSRGPQPVSGASSVSQELRSR